MPPSRLLALAAVLAGLAQAACGGGGSGEEAADTPARPAGGCQAVAPPEPRPEGDLEGPAARLRRDETAVARVRTSCGTFEITLDARRAPRTGGSFAALARRGFYDGLAFHRVVPGFVIQGGDPRGTGEGGPGYTVVEAPPPDAAYTKGVVAMAKAEDEAPGTSGSQFFVVTGDDAQLPPEYALVGRVTHGQAVVERIGGVATGADDAPVHPVVIRSVTIDTVPAGR